MGNDASNQKKQLDSSKIQFLCSKIRNQLEHTEEKKKLEIKGKEKELLKMVISPKRVKEDELSKASSILLDFHLIKCFNILRKYTETISSRSAMLANYNGDMSSISDMLPIIETIIFATSYLQYPAMLEFKQSIQMHFAGNLEEEIRKSKLIDPEVERCFGLFLPDKIELNIYFLEFCRNNNITLDQLNSVGFTFTSNPEQQKLNKGTSLQIDPSKANQIPNATPIPSHPTYNINPLQPNFNFTQQGQGPQYVGFPQMPQMYYAPHPLYHMNQQQPLNGYQYQVSPHNQNAYNQGFGGIPAQVSPRNMYNPINGANVLNMNNQNNQTYSLEGLNPTGDLKKIESKGPFKQENTNNFSFGFKEIDNSLGKYQNSTSIGETQIKTVKTAEPRSREEVPKSISNKAFEDFLGAGSGTNAGSALRGIRFTQDHAEISDASKEKNEEPTPIGMLDSINALIMESEQERMESQAGFQNDGEDDIFKRLENIKRDLSTHSNEIEVNQKKSETKAESEPLDILMDDLNAQLETNYTGRNDLTLTNNKVSFENHDTVCSNVQANNNYIKSKTMGYKYECHEEYKEKVDEMKDEKIVNSESMYIQKFKDFLFEDKEKDK